MGGSTELHEACCEGDLERVRERIRGGADVNAKAFEIRTTPLVLASHRGLLSIVEELLEAGADVEGLEEGSRTTALHWAAEGGHAAVAERLLDAGARLDARDGWFGLEPLGWATVVDYNACLRADRPSSIALLLERGATMDPYSAIALGRLDELGDPRRRAGWALRERTPLHFAASREDAEAIERLLLFGADPAARDAWGVTARGLFPHSGLGDEFGEPLPHVLVEQDLAGQLAARSDLETRVPWLVNEQRSDATPLHLAAEWGRVESTEALLAAGVDPSPKTYGSWMTPLHLAAAGGHGRVVQALLAAGADRRACDVEHGATPEQWAAFHGHEEAEDLLRDS